MKLRSTAIALGVGAATAAGLSLLKVDKPVVIGSTAVVVAGGLMIAGRDEEELNTDSYIESGFNKAKSGDNQGAISDFDKAIEIDQKSAFSACAL